MREFLKASAVAIILSLAGAGASSSWAAEIEVDQVAYVHGDNLVLRSAPERSADRIRRLSYGDKLRVLQLEGDWAQVQEYETAQIGWVHTDYIDRDPT